MNGGDPIDDAIKATDPAPEPTLIQVPIVIASTGRPVVVLVPPDLSDAETIELAAYLLTGLRPHIAASLGPPSPLIVARGRVDR
jgi:hypothetical protein